MNFSTDLPKSCPMVSYIVASAMKCTKYFPGSSKEGPCFRMHAVILKSPSTLPLILVTVEEQGQLNGGKGFILCHIRQVNYAKEPVVGVVKRVQSEAQESEEAECADPVPEKVKKVEEDVKSLPQARGVQSGLRILHIKPINVILNDKLAKAEKVSPKELCSPKVQTELFEGAKKMIEKIGEYTKEKVESYVKLYNILSGARQFL